jgi:hypothetical protein
MTVNLSTYGGWAGIALVGAGYWYLQKQRSANRPSRATEKKQSTKTIDAPKVAPKATKSKKRVEAGQSSGDQAAQTSDANTKKKKKPAKAESDLPTPAKSSAPDDTVDQADEYDNKEFARQLSNAKAGTTLSNATQSSSRPRSVKQSKATDTSQQSKAVHTSKTETYTSGADTSDNNPSVPSSNAGADADDDLSAANSPELTAVDPKGSTSLVDDMLEAPGAGPSVLRITGSNTSQPKKDKKAAPQFEQAETKKQRQNRKKAEAKKQAREDEEKARKIAMENQRRLARGSEGRAAKDGSVFMASQAPSVSSWTAPLPAAAAQNGTNEKVELLDTIEPASTPVSKPVEAGKDWHATLPSEAEQIRLLEEESAWATVTKSKKASKKKANGTSKTGDANVSSTDEHEIPKKQEPKMQEHAAAAVPRPHAKTVPKTSYDLLDEEWEVS